MRLFGRRRKRPAVTVEARGIAADLVIAGFSQLTEEIADLRRLINDRPAPGPDARADGTAAVVVPATPAPVEAPTAEPDPELDLTDIDSRFAWHIRSLVGRAPATKSNGELMDLTVLGRLKDGSIAWVNEELQTFGVIPAALMDDLGSAMPLPDDRLRGRVVSYPWGHIVQAVVPYSLTSLFATRVASAEPTTTAGRVPDSVRGSFRENLRPGDLVLARIAYAASNPVDPKGQTGKVRPAVFVRWERDYACLRAIYDKNSFVAGQGLGTVLTDTSDLLKPSVARNTEFDIDPECLVRVLGRLGPRDLLALHIEETDNTPPGLVRTPKAPPSPTVHKTNPENLDPIHRETESLISAVRTNHSTKTDADAIVGLLTELSRNTVTAGVLGTEGVHIAMVGHVLAGIARADGREPVRGGLAVRLSDALPRLMLDGESRFRLIDDHNNHPVLWLLAPGSATPITEASDEQPSQQARTNARLELPDDYVTPDIVVLDQYSTSIFVADNRLDLSGVLEDLRAGSNCPAWVVGSDAQLGWKAFQGAAASRGWKVEAVDDRDATIAAVLRLIDSHEAQVVTLVTSHSDIVAQVENSGYDVNIVSSLAS